MNSIPLNEVFDIKYGNQFDLYKLEVDANAEINFVSRSSQNLGVVAKVHRFNDVTPFEAGLITVTLGGTYLLSSFIQQERFYTAQNIKVLSPKREMTFGEKLYYCKVIEANRFRYTSHGREANITLDTLLVPDIVPSEYSAMVISEATILNKDAVINLEMEINVTGWKYFQFNDIFDLEKGERIVNSDMEKGNTPCIRPIDNNNGVYEYIDIEPNHSADTITVNYNGSVAEAFYQPKPYFALDDVNVLYPKYKFNPYIALFLITLIRQEKYRFNYGRKWNLGRMVESKIKLPTDKNGNPDWDYMEQYIKTLPYSSSI